jgi:hypothetical protein
MAVSVCNAQLFGKPRNPEKKLFGKSITKKQAKVKEAPSVVKAKKVQQKKKDKIKKDYNNYVETSKKRAYKIQTPEVQARMKQNQKDLTAREKTKKKKNTSVTKKAGKRYK